MGFFSRLTGRQDSSDPEPAQPSGAPEFLPEAVPSADASRGSVPEFSAASGNGSPGVRLYNPYQVRCPLVRRLHCSHTAHRSACRCMPRYGETVAFCDMLNNPRQRLSYYWLYLCAPALILIL